MGRPRRVVLVARCWVEGLGLRCVLLALLQKCPMIMQVLLFRGEGDVRLEVALDSAGIAECICGTGPEILHPVYHAHAVFSLGRIPCPEY